MNLSYLTKTILIGCLIFSPLTIITMHHVVASTTGTSEQLPNDEGIVISTIDTTGYTYMELKNGDRRFWIAAPTTQVKKGDHIRFVESMTMSNFSSKTLNRTFNRLIFVSSTKIRK